MKVKTFSWTKDVDALTYHLKVTFNNMPNNHNKITLKNNFQDQGVVISQTRVLEYDLSSGSPSLAIVDQIFDDYDIGSEIDVEIRMYDGSNQVTIDPSGFPMTTTSSGGGVVKYEEAEGGSGDGRP